MLLPPTLHNPEALAKLTGYISTLYILFSMDEVDHVALSITNVLVGFNVDNLTAEGLLHAAKYVINKKLDKRLVN